MDEVDSFSCDCPAWTTGSLCEQLLYSPVLRTILPTTVLYETGYLYTSPTETAKTVVPTTVLDGSASLYPSPVETKVDHTTVLYESSLFYASPTITTAVHTTLPYDSSAPDISRAETVTAAIPTTVLHESPSMDLSPAVTITTAVPATTPHTTSTLYSSTSTVPTTVPYQSPTLYPSPTAMASTVLHESTSLNMSPTVTITPELSSLSKGEEPLSSTIQTSPEMKTSSHRSSSHTTLVVQPSATMITENNLMTSEITPAILITSPTLYTSHYSMGKIYMYRIFFHFSHFPCEL